MLALLAATQISDPHICPLHRPADCVRLNATIQARKTVHGPGSGGMFQGQAVCTNVAPVTFLCKLGDKPVHVKFFKTATGWHVRVS